MIFLRYESFGGYLRAYPVTAAILAANLLIFLLDLMLGHALFELGAFYQHPLFDRFGLGQPWRYVTSMFLHGGWQHLLFNCFSILVFAPPLERLLGHSRYLIFYLLSGVLGNALSALVHASAGNVSVGASGAIYGVFGAYLFLALYRKYSMDEGSRKTVYMILIFGLIYSLMSARINIWAHVGGGIAGFAMMGTLLRRK